MEASAGLDLKEPSFEITTSSTQEGSAMRTKQSYRAKLKGTTDRPGKMNEEPGYCQEEFRGKWVLSLRPKILKHWFGAFVCHRAVTGESSASCVRLD